MGQLKERCKNVTGVTRSDEKEHRRQFLVKDCGRTGNGESKVTAETTKTDEVEKVFSQVMETR